MCVSVCVGVEFWKAQSGSRMGGHQFYSLGIPFLLALFAIAIGRVCYSIWWKPKRLERMLKQQGISGTPYKPLIGDMKEFSSQLSEAWSKPITLTHHIVPRVDPFTLSIVQKYGKISMSWRGTTPRLIIKDTELMKEVLSNKLGHFGKPPLNPIILILARGLAIQEGEDWARHRRIINPAFHMDKLKGMMTVFSISCNKMIEQWKKMVGHQESCEVDVWPEFQKLTMNVISRAAFGSNYEEGKKIFELQRELTALVIEAMQTLYIPGFRFVPTKKNQRRKKLNKEITSMLRDLVQRKENAMRAAQSNADNLLGLLLQSTDQNNLPQNATDTKGKRLTIEEIIEECKQFYIAGQETTSSLLAWTMIVLAMHPDWQAKARDEVLKFCGKKEPNFEDLTHLKIVAMILNETLRLYPPAIAQYMHTYQETRIGDICLPKGVDVMLPTLLIHHDPELWGNDAEEFRPERFSEGVLKASNNHQAFFPFGWGPRTCIGQNFAMLEAKTALAMILQHFSLELSPTYTHAPHTVMILEPQHGAQMIIHRI